MIATAAAGAASRGRRSPSRTLRRLRVACVASLVLAASGCSGAQEWLMQDAARIVRPESLSPATLAAARKPRDPASPRPVALLLLGAQGTEVMDLLAPYELLSRSGHFDVFTVAASGEPIAITGALATVPDFTVDDAPSAALIVIPAVADPSEAALQRFLIERAPDAQMLLSICEGARLLAASGLLDGRRATTHFFALDALQARHPDVGFRHGHRYVQDGRIVSSAGVSAGLDASLYAIEQFAGRDAALRSAAGIGYRWIEEPDPAGETQRAPSTQIGAVEIARLLGNTLFHSRSQRVGVWLEDGVSEIGLAGLVDTLPRSLTLYLDTLSAQRVVRTRHGLSLMASAAPEAGDLDLLIVPPGSSTPARAGQREIVDLRETPAGAAVAAGLELVARRSAPADARIVAKMIEHPLPADDAR